MDPYSSNLGSISTAATALTAAGEAKRSVLLPVAMTVYSMQTASANKLQLTEMAIAYIAQHQLSSRIHLHLSQLTPKNELEKQICAAPDLFNAVLLSSHFICKHFVRSE